MLILTAPLLIDGIGDAPVSDATVHVDGTRISYAGPASSAPPTPADAEVVDLPGHTLLPGLIDCHVHCTGLWNATAGARRSSGPLAGEVTGGPKRRADAFRGPGAPGETEDGAAMLHALTPLRQLLASGVTTVRDVGAPGSTGYDLRAAVNEGTIPGPRMLVAGPIIRPTGGHGHRGSVEADGVDQVRQAVRRAFRDGADLIKLTASGGGGTAGTDMGRPTFSVDELHCAAVGAGQRGSYVTAHCHSIEGMVRCLDAGIPMLEHATFMDTDRQVRWEPAIAGRLRDQGVVVSPTVAVFGRLLEDPQTTTRSADPEERRYWEFQREGFERRLELVGRLHEAGVTLIIGSDVPCRGVSFDDFPYSVGLHVRAGVPPIAAIKSATGISARALGVADVTGSLRAGLDADIIAVKGDPSTRIDDLARVRLVLQRGAFVRRDPAE